MFPCVRVRLKKKRETADRVNRLSCDALRHRLLHQVPYFRIGIRITAPADCFTS